MPLASSLATLLTGGLGRGSRLLAAAQNGDAATVAEILSAQPNLATYCGIVAGNGQTALHRAAAAGHVDVCKAVLEPLKQRAGVVESLVASGRHKPTAALKWRRLLATLLNGKNGDGFTPLMAACRAGHAQVAAYLLREGADPLIPDVANQRTALHYAAAGGHADCLRLLCSDSVMVPTPLGPRTLRDVIVRDMQVQSCRYVDQRAYGGLTAMHFAVVTGQLEAVQVLLRAGASIMVKTDGEAYLGDEYLIPGSTPLHIAVIVGSVSIVHALLQAHAELMNVVGQGLDERGRRPWEGHSRTDVRSMRNHFRKLPFHLARDRGAMQLAQLVDPRIPVDAALDAARDTDHGIGPKRLQTIVSMVLQKQLLHWLDQCQQDLQAETKAGGSAASGAATPPSSAGRDPGQPPVVAVAGAGASPAASTAATAASPVQAALAAIRSTLQRTASGSGSRQRLSSTNGGSGRLELSIEAIPESRPSPPPRYSLEQQQQQLQLEQRSGGSIVQGSAAAAPGSVPSGQAMPGARLSALGSAGGSAFGAAAQQQQQQQCEEPPSPFASAAARGVFGSRSAPASPLQPLFPQGQTPPPPPGVPAPVATSMPNPESLGPDRMPSLRGYMGMLSVKRERARSMENIDLLALLSGQQQQQQAQQPGHGRQAQQVQAGLGMAPPSAPIHSPSLMRQVSSPPSFHAAALRLEADSQGLTDQQSYDNSTSDQLSGGWSLLPDSGLPSTSGGLPQASPPAPAPTLTVVQSSAQHRRTSSTTSAGMRGMLSSLRDRLRSSDLGSSTTLGSGAVAAAGGAELISVAGTGPGPAAQAVAAEAAASKELGSDKECDDSEAGSQCGGSEGSMEDKECGVCLDHVVEVAFAGCQHCLCIDCARNLTRQEKKPPHCPFCRRMVVGFHRVSSMTRASSPTHARQQA